MKINILQIGASLCQKLRQLCLLQIRANVVTKWGSFIITNQGRCCCRLGQLLQIRATVITKQGSYYKLGQNVLQIGAAIRNQGNYYKLGHDNNSFCYQVLVEVCMFLIIFYYIVNVCVYVFLSKLQRKSKVLIVLDDVIADMISNKKLNPAVTGLEVKN